MARAAFDRLSFLDSTFLIAESTTNHMHVAGTATYEAGPLRCPDGGTIGQGFVVGYGIDYAEQYRGLRDIRVLV